MFKSRLRLLFLSLLALALLGAGCGRETADTAPDGSVPPQTEAPQPAESQAQPPQKPDLSVRLESQCAADRSLRYTVTVNNRSDGPAGGFVARIVATKRDLTSSSAEGTSNYWTAEGLEPRKQLVYTGTIPATLLKSEDITSLRVKVDAEEMVDELNENNNQKEVESACERVRPDLSSRLTVSCSADGSISYTVVVRNAGNDTAGTFRTKGIAIKRDGSTPAAEEASMEWSAEALSPGGTLTYSATIPAEVVKTEEITAIRAKTDAAETIIESDENNNQREERVICE